MTQPYALAAYDELGQAVLFPLEGTAEGYASFAVQDDDGSLIAVASEPELEPPDGELPFYDSDGSTLLATFQFVPFGEVLGDQLSYASFAQGVNASLELALVQGLRLPVLWPNAGDYYDPDAIGLDSGYAQVEIAPAGLRLIGYGDGFLRMRARVDVLIDVHDKLERGAGDMLSRLDSVYSQYQPPANAELMRWSYQTLRTAASTTGAGPTYVYRIIAEHAIPVAVAVPAKIGNGDYGAQLIEAAIQSAFVSLVATPLGAQSEHANYSAVYRAGTALWASTTIEHGLEVAGRMGGIGAGSPRIARRDGRLIATLGVPIETGTLALWTALDRIVSSFAKASIEGAVFELPSATLLGVDGASYVLQVDCGFSVEEPR